MQHAAGSIGTEALTGRTRAPELAIVVPTFNVSRSAYSAPRSICAAVPAELADTDADWAGIRFLRDKPDHDPDWDALGFEYTFHDDHDEGGWGRHLWVYAEESGCPDNVAWLVQKFLKKFRPDQCWSLTYSTTCSKPRTGEFGGGAVFVTADEIKWQNAYNFIEDQRAAFKVKHSKAHRAKKGEKP